MSKQKSLIILGIETSCDETAVSVVEARNDNIKVLSNMVSSQVKLHAQWGGVVPNLAAREHLKNIVPVLNMAFKKAAIKPADINLIAATQGPGLIPALLIGTNAAKTLSYVWQKLLIGIHHIEGHIYANFIHPHPSLRATLSLSRERGLGGEGQIHPVEYRKAVSRYGGIFHRVKFPILCLVVSGGHTQLILIKKHLDYKIVGETLDDAAGEAFDKVARILNLGYPGGPAIAKLVSRWKSQILNPKSQTNTKYYINLPRPMINSNNLNMSFSGLKTAVLYETKKHSQILKNMRIVSLLCYEFQQAVIDVLISKTLKTAKIYQPKTIMLAGGVSANQELRKQMGSAIKKYLPITNYKLPITNYSIDNAAMIAAAGYYRWKFMSVAQRKKSLNNWKTLQPDANLKLK